MGTHPGNPRNRAEDAEPAVDPKIARRTAMHAAEHTENHEECLLMLDYLGIKWLSHKPPSAP